MPTRRPTSPRRWRFAEPNNPPTRSQRPGLTALGIARRFARWRRVSDPRTEIPADGLLPERYHRHPPYLYSDEEIDRLLAAAIELPSANGLRACSYATLFGLLAVTGLRVSEALMLDRDDVDFAQELLTIRRTKFGKSRLVPMHRSAREALER